MAGPPPEYPAHDSKVAEVPASPLPELQPVGKAAASGDGATSLAVALTRGSPALPCDGASPEKDGSIPALAAVERRRKWVDVEG